MDVNKATYWIAVGVLALGLSSQYRQGGFTAVHRVAERASSELWRVATRAEETLALATGRIGREKLPVDAMVASLDRAETVREQSEVLRERARDQAELTRGRERAQAEMIRAQVEMQRAEIERLRWRSRSSVRLAAAEGRRAVVVCPKTGVRIMVNRVPDTADMSSVVAVADTF
jgi:hypothetical protein